MKNILYFTKEARKEMAEKGKSFCLGVMTTLMAINYTSLKIHFCNIQRLLVLGWGSTTALGLSN